MRKHLGLVLPLTIAALVATSCASTSNHGLLTRSTSDAAGLLRNATSFEEIGPVRGQACRFFLLAIIPFGNSTTGAAMKKALKDGGDAIVNASVTTSLYGFIPFYNILALTCTTVEGVAIRFE